MLSWKRNTRRAFDEDAGPILPLKLNCVCAIARSYVRQSQELTGSVNTSAFSGTNPTGELDNKVARHSPKNGRQLYPIHRRRVPESEIVSQCRTSSPRTTPLFDGLLNLPPDPNTEH